MYALLLIAYLDMYTIWLLVTMFHHNCGILFMHCFEFTSSNQLATLLDPKVA